MKKALCLVLVFAMLCGTLLACVPTEEPPAGATTSTTKPDEGGSQKPDEGGSQKPDDGGSQKPDEGGSQKPDDGGSQKPDEGGSQKPDEGGNQQPGEGGMDEEKKVEILGYLKELLAGYLWNPMTEIPNKMLPGGNLIQPTSIPNGYASNVNVSALPANGFGEQWQMVLENLSESQTFFTVLSVVEGLTTSSVAAFEQFLDKNPSDTAHHNFLNGIYSVTIRCDKANIYYVLDYEANLPVLGRQNVQIALSMNLLSKDKQVRVQLGDANALAYTVKKDAYTFAIKYLGVRRAYFEIVKEKNGNLDGHIYEYLDLNAVTLASVADFYITDSYTTVVGNKAGGMIGFKGYISELYKTSTGKLVAYEVREELLGLTYNTLWFDLHQIGGIQSIRYREETDSQEGGFFLNGGNQLWKAKNVGMLGGLKAKSRRFDIEFRTQYFYSWNAAEEKYTAHAVEVPMLFVQEEYYDSLAKDVKSENGLSISVNVGGTDLQKLMADYDSLIDVLVDNVGKVTADKIVEMIGTKKTFN